MKKLMMLSFIFVGVHGCMMAQIATRSRPQDKIVQEDIQEAIHVTPEGDEEIVLVAEEPELSIPVKEQEVEYKETMGPWPLDLPARVLPVPYCNECVETDDGKPRRRVRFWPIDLPVRVLPTPYCGGCKEVEV